ncbi:MAG: photosynthetic complex putative assembly protein PuhB, partial [Burkholderiales bacterium]
MNVNPHHEHEFEVAPGLPEALPSGERLLWQGAPDWKTLALHVFHVRTLAVYFLVMMVLQALYLLGEQQPRWWVPLTTSLVLSLTALGVLSWMAWMTARTTLYTLTSKRVVMRIGIVLTLTFNLPLRRIASAGLRLDADGMGDIPLSLAAGERLGLLHLWPHSRP